MGAEAGHDGKRTPLSGKLHAQRRQHIRLGTGEAAGNEHQLGVNDALGLHAALGTADRPVEVHDADAAHAARLVPQDLEGVHGPLAHLGPHEGDGLLLAVVGLLDVGPLRPGVACRGRLGRAGHELQLAHAPGALAHGRAQAVVARVSAADDHDVLADRIDGGRAAGKHRLGRRREVVHGKDHAAGSQALGKALGAEPAWGARASGDHHGVEVCQQTLGNVRPGGVRLEPKLNAQLAHEPNAALHHVLGQLHVGDAIHEQATCAVGLLHDGHASPAAGELPGRGQAGGARANHGHARRIRRDRREARGPTVRPLPVGDGALVVVDGLGLVVAAQVAGRLAQGRADAARELGQRAREREALCGLCPLATVEQVVPLRDEVVQRAAGGARLAKGDARLAEGNAAHHAAAGLRALLLGRKRHVELVVVARALGNGTQVVGTAAQVKECAGLAHATSPPSLRRRRTAGRRHGTCPCPRPPARARGRARSPSE